MLVLSTAVLVLSIAVLVLVIELQCRIAELCQKMMKPESLLTATTTVATREQADELAREIMARRCAACVQVDGPITSHYVWEGAVQSETEWRLTIKTTRAAEPALAELVHRSHPYELPQWWVASPEQVSEAYGQWVQDAVQPQ